MSELENPDLVFYSFQSPEELEATVTPGKEFHVVRLDEKPIRVDGWQLKLDRGTFEDCLQIMERSDIDDRFLADSYIQSPSSFSSAQNYLIELYSLVRRRDSSYLNDLVVEFLGITEGYKAYSESEEMLKYLIKLLLHYLKYQTILGFFLIHSLFVQCQFPSSKTCSHCLYQMPEMPLNMREWTCPSCGTHQETKMQVEIPIAIVVSLAIP